MELAKEHGLVVLAANAPRPLARRIARGGVDAARWDPHFPDELFASEGAYQMRFDAAMRGMGSSSGDHSKDTAALQTWFAAQCVKDEVMAESIARQVDSTWPPSPVVHWCGKFHSDYYLGTVERLVRRRPQLLIGVVSTLTGTLDKSSLTEDDRYRADYIWLVEDLGAR